jgi:hypothetical protein
MVELVTLVQQIKAVLRLSEAKKQRLGDFGNTASSSMCHSTKVHGSDIPGSDINESDKAGLDNQITRQ